MDIDVINSGIEFAGDKLWTWLVLPVLVILGLNFTIRSGFVQVRLFPAMIRVLGDKTPLTADGKPQSLSSFQAFTVSAASRVGVGNIAGVGTAIAVGGPGAVFWMWLMALIGGASSFIESSLAQLFKVRDKDGFRGGPAYYMTRGLRQKWMGVAFAAILIVCFPFAFNSLQANTIASTITTTTKDLSGADLGWLVWVIGIALAALTAAVIFGGAHRIASVTQAVVPAMALMYLLLGLVVIGVNIQQLPAAFASIFTSAFAPNPVIGATIGYVIMTGIKRGMFSNEAGLGSAPNAGASAAVTHPVKQGLVQTLGVYFDTFLICSLTAFIILVSNPNLADGTKGIDLTQNALSSSLGTWTGILLSIIVFLLAFSSILGNYFYGESNMEFLSTSKKVLTTYRVLVIVMILVGSTAETAIIWSAADAIMGLMALLNLVAIGFLSPIGFRLLRDYNQQRREGRDPVFTRDRMPDVRGVECWDDELSVTGPIETLRTEKA